MLFTENQIEMRKNRFFGCVVIALVLSACNFHQSVNKDLTTGAFSRGDGLSCDKVSVEINGEEVSRTSFVQGEKVSLVFNNIEGFKKIGNKVFPGLSIFIIKNEKDTVIYESDLFDDLPNGTDLSPLQLTSYFVASLPYENNEKYKAHVKIWDKKGKGTFVYEYPFRVKENKLLSVKSKDLNYSTIYLWDETDQHVVTDKEINSQNTFILIMEKISGLDIVDGKVFPSFSIEIANAAGEQVLYNSDILAEFEKSGIDAKEFEENQFPVTLTFSKGYVQNPSTLKAVLTDRTSGKRLDIFAELKIESKIIK